MCGDYEKMVFVILCKESYFLSHELTFENDLACSYALACLLLDECLCVVTLLFLKKSFDLHHLRSPCCFQGILAGNGLHRIGQDSMSEAVNTLRIPTSALEKGPDSMPARDGNPITGKELT